MILYRKQTIYQISESIGFSPSTIKRCLAELSFIWEQPTVTGNGVVHIDATYFGRNTGILQALESGTGRQLYMYQFQMVAIIRRETDFTYKEVSGMPNTSNMIEGAFSDMKKNLRNHPGMNEDKRKRMMSVFF